MLTPSTGLYSCTHTNPNHMACPKCGVVMVMRPAHPNSLIAAHEHFCNNYSCVDGPKRTPVDTSFAGCFMSDRFHRLHGKNF